ncbi:hypothetical protein HDU83_005917 [Entophlyctis luteolus]|nr:hypothetical protein HDU82_005714 [Entophlyctis luteolus]KAJ3342893.1 hypothetical protein HDU83_005917 [Entophlyctis luteolus]KAJ3379715.1 hypothetical protein HDU84_006447 [Entophlyctis sp. JEL0112]
MLSTALCLVAHELFAPAPATSPASAAATASAAASQDLEYALLGLLDRFSLVSLGLDNTPPSAPVEFYNIHNSELFEIGVFVLRKGHSMPIHDHPNMTVFTKVVYGDLHVRKFEFIDPPDNVKRSETDCLCAKVLRDTICRATSSIVNPFDHPSDSDSNQTIFKIYPSDGPNLHSFTAVSDFAVILDVVGPPYLHGEREVTYYTEIASIRSDSSPESALTGFAAPCSLFGAETDNHATLLSTMRPVTPTASSTTSEPLSVSENKLKRKRSPSEDLLDENPFSAVDALFERAAARAESAPRSSPIATVGVTTERLVDMVLHSSASPARFSQSREATTDSGSDSNTACNNHRTTPPNSSGRDSLQSPRESASPHINGKYGDSPVAASTSSIVSSTIKPTRLVWLQPDSSIEFDVVERQYPGLPVADYMKLLDGYNKSGRPKNATARAHEIRRICKKVEKAVDKILAETI